MTTERLAAGQQDPLATLLGALIFAIFTYLFYDTVTIPTTPLDPPDARLVLRAFHYTLGLSVWALVAVRLYWWKTGPRPSPPPGLPPAAFALNRAILFALFLTFFVTAIVGAIYAYADGQPVSLYGVHLPRVIPESYALRVFGGYFHSAFGFYYLGLVALWLLVGLYQHLRYRAGLLRLLPGPRV
jgi:cytochrome b561